MSKERVSLDLPDLGGFAPRAGRAAPPAKAVEVAAEKAGFRTRHAAAPAPKPKADFDARTLRKSNRTAKLNIALSPEARARFWDLAQELELTSGDETLTAMMDALEQSLRKQQ